MPTLHEIQKPVDGQLKEFDHRFRASMKTRVPLLDTIMRYIVKRKGKRIRPLFVFYSALLNGSITESTYTAATLIELLHTATLVHDDVVDDANQRRGLFSINALWKNKIAVLVGDFLLSRGMLLALENEEYEILQNVSKAVKQMSEGELLQIEKARRLDIEESVYFDIISKKTASLFSSCCACGTLSGGAEPEAVEAMRLFGKKLGIAFQIRDDIFDFSLNNKTGKPNGTDIKEQKMTLPLIHMLENSSAREKRKTIRIIKHHHTDANRVGEVIQAVHESGGIEYAHEKMLEYRQQALDILFTFPDNEARQMLEKLVVYTTERDK